MAAQTYAYVLGGTVEWLWPHNPEAPMPAPQPAIADVFAPDVAAHMVPCDATVEQGWTYDGHAFAAPVIVVPPAPPRQVEVSILLDALSTSKRAAISQDNRDRLIARGAKGPVAPDDPKVVRAAADVAVKVPGFTPAAWFDLALAPAT